LSEKKKTNKKEAGITGKITQKLSRYIQFTPFLSITIIFRDAKLIWRWTFS